jgi:glycosyltransferase involved in cell wall biosynthesis
VLFLYSTNLVDFRLYYRLAKKHGLKLVTERNEYPILIRKKVFIKSFIYKNFILPVVYRIFDGIVLMTDFLHEFYRPHLNKKTAIIKVPMTVDFDRFKIEKTETKEEYIFYAGTLIQEKDGIETLISAFLKVKESNPDIKLKIAGGSSAEMDRLKSKLYITEKDRIEFLGLIPGKDIPGMLLNAKILMLPRPLSKQAEGGFPTKLGEYLASGRPVIATPVGEIPKYLTHKKDIVFCYDLNPSTLSEIITEVLNNYSEYLEIGQKGRVTAENNFELMNNVDSLHKFYKEV